MSDTTLNRSTRSAKVLEAVQLLEQSASVQNSAVQSAELESARIHQRISALYGSLTFLRWARFARRGVDATIVWRPGAILIAVTLIGGVMFAVFQSPTTGIVSGIVTLVATYLLLNYPSDSKAVESTGRIDAELAELKSTVAPLDCRLQELKTELKTLTNELNEARLQLDGEQRIASDEHRRKQLLAENWRAMRSVEFEQFLERVFAELGYVVETTKVTGDQGIDLIIAYRGKRIAIQVKGYLHSVSNSAVQEAHTGMTHYRCDAAAVITNSKFTQSAVELAKSVRCQLVDEDLLPSLVLGRVHLWSMCFEGNN